MEYVVQGANDPDGRALGTVSMSDVAITQQRWYRYWLSCRRSRRSCRRTGEPITNIDRRITTAIPGAIEGRLAHTMTVVSAKQVGAIHGWVASIRRLQGTLHDLRDPAAVCDFSCLGNEKGNKKGEVRVKLRSTKMTEKPSAPILLTSQAEFVAVDG